MKTIPEIKKLCSDIVRLGEEATPGPWHWVNSETDVPIDFSVCNDERLTKKAQKDNIYPPFSLRTTWEKECEGLGYSLPKFIVDNDDRVMIKADAQLIGAARVLTPQLAKALLVAIGLLEDIMCAFSSGDASYNAAENSLTEIRKLFP
jgi:hypothetical protein